MKLIRQLSYGKASAWTLAFFIMLCFSAVSQATVKSVNVDRYTDIGNGNVTWEQGTLFVNGGFIPITSLDQTLAQAGLTAEMLGLINGKAVMLQSLWVQLDAITPHYLKPFVASSETYNIDSVPYIIVTSSKVKPTVNISAKTPTASETGTNGEFLISLNGPLSKDIVIAFKINGTAKNRKDYTLLKNNVKILAGNVSAAITVAPVAMR